MIKNCTQFHYLNDLDVNDVFAWEYGDRNNFMVTDILTCQDPETAKVYVVTCISGDEPGWRRGEKTSYIHPEEWEVYVS